MPEEQFISLMRSCGDFCPESWVDDIEPMYRGADPAHDFSHILRVFRNAQIIGPREGADMQVLLWSVLLHDAGSTTKLSQGSEESESLRRKAADDLLKKVGLPEEVRTEVLYAVEVHRFSKGIKPVTLEAKVLQDADRLDAIGAIGIARVFMTGGNLCRALYNPQDPFCKTREPDDKKWNLDHFYRKLLQLESGMHTKTARELAGRRSAVLRRYLADLEEEIGIGLETGSGGNPGECG
jgi:uncharacterized protein